MVYVTEETMAKLKGKTGDDLAMTPYERARVGSMIRIQLPITDRAAMREYAALLRGLATQLDLAGTSYDRRDFDLYNIIKGRVAAVNHSARDAKYRLSAEAGFADETQTMADQDRQN